MASVSAEAWAELTAPDGRVFYHNSCLKQSCWRIPTELSETTHQPRWLEYKIWDGRTFFHDALSNVSVWHSPTRTVLIEQDYNGETSQNIGESDEYLHSDNLSRNFLSASRHRVQRMRSVEQEHIANLVGLLKNIGALSPSATFEEFETFFNSFPLPATRKREVFESFLADLSRVQRRVQRTRDERLRVKLKSVINNEKGVDYAASLEEIEQFLGSRTSWGELSEMQRLSVWRSSMLQHLKDVRSRIAAGEALSRVLRVQRKDRDLVRNALLDLFEAGSIDIWKHSSAEIVSTLRKTFPNLKPLGRPGIVEYELVGTFLVNLHQGLAPFAEIPKPSIM